MKGYSINIPENCASARLEGVNASYKDLAQVCGNIKSKNAEWAISYLEKAAKGDIAVLYKKHNTRLGHRRELGGRKGRYPKKSAAIVLKVLKSAIANAAVKGLDGELFIRHAAANKKLSYGRIASKGRWARSFLETSRVEIILQGPEVPKGVEFTPPKKPEQKKPEPKEKPKPEVKKPGPTEAKPEATEQPKPEVKKPEPKAEAKEEHKKKKTRKKAASKKAAKGDS